VQEAVVGGDNSGQVGRRPVRRQQVLHAQTQLHYRVVRVPAQQQRLPVSAFECACKEQQWRMPDEASKTLDT